MPQEASMDLTRRPLRAPAGAYVFLNTTKKMNQKMMMMIQTMRTAKQSGPHFAHTSTLSKRYELSDGAIPLPESPKLKEAQRFSENIERFSAILRIYYYYLVYLIFECKI